MNTQLREQVITVGELAVIVEKGFREQCDELRAFRGQVRDEFLEMHVELDGIHRELEGIYKKLDGMHVEIE